MSPAGIMPPQDCHYTWNEETNRLYLHIFSYPDRRVRLCGINAEDVEYIQLLNDASYLVPKVAPDKININGVVDEAGSLIVNLPLKKPDVEVPVVELFMKKGWKH
jgi:alpha-L-fucosidase